MDKKENLEKFFDKLLKKLWSMPKTQKRVFTIYLCIWEDEKYKIIREKMTEQINIIRKNNSLKPITPYFFEYNINFFKDRDKLIKKCVEYCFKIIK